MRRAVLGGAGLMLLGRAAPAAIVRHAVIGKDGWLFLVWDEPRRVDFPRIRQVARVINETAEALRRAGIKPVIALTPAKSRVYRDFLPEDFQFSADGQNRYGVVLEELRKSGTLVPDLAPVFAGLRTSQPQELLFFKADTHWTAPGAEAAATQVATQMKASLGLPPSSRPGIRLGPAVMLQQPRNDLTEALPRPDRAKYPLQRYPIHQPVASQGSAALVEDDTADVAVVGSSYMHPSYNFAAMLSNQLGRPASLHWKVHSYGPYRTLLEYLASPGFKRSRPKTLVLSLHEVDLNSAPDSDAWSEPMDTPSYLTAMRRALGS
jgi:alginate O-acetyltransferase complex protein AlgJ